MNKATLWSKSIVNNIKQGIGITGDLERRAVESQGLMRRATSTCWLWNRAVGKCKEAGINPMRNRWRPQWVTGLGEDRLG